MVIIRFVARVAERQTRRSQKPLGKPVRVQISPRAPSKCQVKGFKMAMRPEIKKLAVMIGGLTGRLNKITEESPEYYSLACVLDDEMAKSFIIRFAILCSYLFCSLFLTKTYTLCNLRHFVV